jgi:hypothetical protein
MTLKSFLFFMLFVVGAAQVLAAPVGEANRNSNRIVHPPRLGSPLILHQILPH